MQPLQLAQWWLLLVYGALLLVTRRKLLALPMAVALAVAAGRRRGVVVGYVADHRGWCLVVLAFALLALGGWLTAFKHRRRAARAESPAPAFG